MNHVVRDLILPPGGWHATHVTTGDVLTLTQIEGAQVVDLIAINPAVPHDYLSMWMSCCFNRSWKLTKPHRLVSHSGRPMLRIVEDTLGENYSGGGYCNPALNDEWHGSPEDPSCADNLHAGLKALDMDLTGLTGDACLNVWMTVNYRPNGTWEIGECVAQAADRISFAVDADLAVVLSNCPKTRTKTNRGSTKSVRFTHGRDVQS